MTADAFVAARDVERGNSVWSSVEFGGFNLVTPAPLGGAFPAAGARSVGAQATTAAAAHGALPIEVAPTGAALGAEMRGVSPAGWTTRSPPRSVHAAWLAHSVLLFRGRSLSDDGFISFSRHFGDLDLPPVQENGRRFVEDKPEIHIVSNVLGADGRPIGSLGAGEALRHTDVSYLPKPPKASVL